jgi:hypothetical protein
MSAVEATRPDAVASYVPALTRHRRRHAVGWWLGAAAVVALALGLRLWGLRQGLPYAYNADENAHFLPHAIGMFGHDLDPDYYVNPPAYTYVLHLLLELRYGGRLAVGDAFATDPGALWAMARAASGALGAVAVGLLFLAGRRLAGPAVGLLAAALLAVGFLPVFYGHLALNDVPTLAPLCLALWGAAGILRDGRGRHYAIAGIGLGLAAATKYTGGIVLLAIIAAAVPHGRPAIKWLVLAGLLSLVAFVVANPYAVLHHHAFLEGLSHQSDASREAQGKLGLTHENGWVYYLWSFGWGLGWAPLVLAGLAVPLLAIARRWKELAFLAPAPILFVLFMGSQERFFGRWILPVMPFVCLLAAAGAAIVVTALTRRAPGLRPTVGALVAIGLLGQGIVYSVHNDRVLSRDDTRGLTRAWLVDHVPAGSRIVVEPGVVPDGWAQDIGAPFAGLPNGNRWAKYPTSRSLVDPDTGKDVPPPGVVVSIEDFEKTLRPELVSTFEREGYCWVVVGSTQRGRAEADPGAVPGAIAYYRELERRGDVAYHASPYGKGEGPVAFNFDWSFNFYPLSYARPGPDMTVYRLRGGACAT